MSMEPLANEVLRHDKILICTVGLPRSGKSTWAGKQECPVVNPDSIRIAIHGQPFIMRAEPFVWAVAKVMVRSLFLAGHKLVVLDATNVTKKRRDEWVCPEEWATYFKMIYTPAAECVDRTVDDPTMVEVIRRMEKQWEPLGEYERFWSMS